MLFFKSKPKFDEILPPPPPLPSAELEEPEEKPKLFDGLVKPKSKKEVSEVQEFGKLIKDLEKELASKKSSSKKINKIQGKKLPSYKRIKQTEFTDISKESDLELPEVVEFPKDDTDFQDKLEDELKINGFEGIRLESNQAKPKEIVEAEEEIKNAIEKIKQQEKPSFFKSLFTKKDKTEEKKEEIKKEIQDKMDIGISKTDGVSKINDNLNKARESLMKFDLETAKNMYIEIMKIYNELSEDDKSKVYNDIKELYFERKSAERLKA